MPEGEEKGQWYSNKDIYEMVQGLGREMGELRGEMRETRAMIRQYNGLRQRIDGVDTRQEELEVRLNAIEQRGVGAASVGRGIREWGAVAIALSGAIVGIIGLILAFRR